MNKFFIKKTASTANRAITRAEGDSLRTIANGFISMIPDSTKFTAEQLERPASMIPGTEDAISPFGPLANPILRLRANLYGNKVKPTFSYLANDTIDELVANGDIGQAVSLRAPGYIAHAAGGSILGRLIAGNNHKLLGYGLGALGGLATNYARRKLYYGDNVNW